MSQSFFVDPNPQDGWFENDNYFLSKSNEVREQAMLRPGVCGV